MTAAADRFQRHLRLRRRSGERGATLVEYALLVAALAVPTVAAIDVLHDGASAATLATADRISEGPQMDRTPDDADPPGDAPSDPDPTTTTTTTTTVPPTTAPPTTAPPTTAPPTTAPPTTAPPATTSTAAWGDTTVEDLGNLWRARTSVTIRDDLGDPVEGATVILRIEYRRDGVWAPSGSDLTAVTSSTGTLLVESGEFARRGRPRDRVTDLRFSVVSVQDGGLTWDGTPPPMVIGAP